MILLVALIIWLLIVVLAGILPPVFRPLRGREDYSVAERRVSWWRNYLTAHATQLSAATFMGFPGLIYSIGLAITYAHYIPYMIGSCAFWLIFGVTVWRLARKYKFITPTDFLAWYYGGGSLFRIFIAIVYIITLLPYIQLQVGGAGLIFNMASNGAIPIWVGGLIAYIAVTAYLWVGGYRAITIVDTIQGVVLLSGLWAGSLAVIFGLGGGNINLLIDKVPKLMYVSGVGGYDWLFMATFAISYGAGWAFHPHMWINMYTPKSAKAQKLWSTTIYIENMIHGILLSLAAIFAAALIPGVKPDLAFLTGAMRYSEILGAWLLVGIGAAIVTTVDSQLHSIGLLISHDILERGRAYFSDRAFIWINRALLMVVAAIGYILYFIYPYPLGIIAGYAAALGLIMAPPIIAALTAQKWITKEGVVVGLVAALISIIVFSTGPLANLYRIHYAAWAIVMETLVMAIVSIFTKSKPSKEVINELISVSEIHSK
jgi:SSS family solute:Na+ symporter